MAGSADETDLRQLLRGNPMRGAVDVGFTHEPDYFLGTGLAGAEDKTLAAWENGRLVAAGRCVIQPRWLNGSPRRCAYLKELRLDASVQGRWDILRRGYDFFAAEYARDPADYCFTSIVADNQRARRVLERGSRGLPRYEPISDFHTLILRARSSGPGCVPAGLRLARGDSVSVEQLSELLNRYNCGRNLAAHWTPEQIDRLASRGLGRNDFLVLQHGDTLVGCAAVWDQRAYRQIVVHAYRGLLAAARPIINLAGALLGWPHFPPNGSTLAQAFLSPLCIDPNWKTALPCLVRASLSDATRRGLSCLATGLAGDDPLWPILSRAFHGMHYASRLYAVTWPDRPQKILRLDGRPCLPELAFL